MKKLIALLLSFAILAGITACGASGTPAADTPEPAANNSEPAPSAEKEPAESGADAAAPETNGEKPYAGATITWWTYPYTGEDQGYWNDRAAVFYEQTGITVETTIIPWGADGSAKLSAGFLSGTGPDVVYMTAETAYDLISAGHLLELSSVVPAEVLNDEIYLEKTKTGGQQYMLPFSGGASYRGMAFNLDLLKAAGVDSVPTTRQEFVDAALKVKEANICEYPIMIPMATAAETPMTSILPNIWSGGGDFVNDSGEIVFDSAENLETMQWMYDLIYTHGVLSEDCTGIDTVAQIDLFIEGKIAMLFGETWPYLDRRDEIDFEWTTALGISDGKHDVMTFCPTDMVAVNANASNQDAAIEWLKFLISVDQRNNFRENCYGSLLQLNKSADPIVYPVDCINADMAALGSHSRALPITKGCSTMTNEICTNTQLMMMGELTPAEAVAAIQVACEAVGG